MSPVTSDADNDSLPELRFTAVVSASQKVEASMGGASSPTPPTPPTVNCVWSSDDDDNYPGVVDDCAVAIVHQRTVGPVSEVRACFSALLHEAIEPAFLDSIITVTIIPESTQPLSCPRPFCE